MKREHATAAVVPQISRRTLPDQVVDLLGRRIVRGDFGQTGGLPTEPALVAEYGVSRNVLREAIKVLASKRLIEVRPKTGTRVRARAEWNILDPDVLAWFSIDGRDLKNAHDLVEFRRIIEPMAARLAALRATDQDIARIRKTLDGLLACIGRPKDVPVADIAFHRSIYDASHNVILSHLGSLLTRLFQSQVVMTTAAPGSFERGLPLHKKVTEAIARRSPKQAEAYSRQLVEMPYRDLHDRLHPNDDGLL
jgi:DNA-binding FadR family transcriptional regulator